MTTLFSQKNVALFGLIAALLFNLLLIIPTIADNLEDPNLIHYFNGDEGGQMDLVWSYYSGEHRDSIRWDFDHGLLMRYVADIARLFSGIVTFTPTTFVLILRWLYLIAWLASVTMLWHIVGYHFSKGWPQAMAALLLATQPVLSYLAGNMKPEPVVFLFMLTGLHFSLRLIDEPSRRMIVMATAFAALAFITKFAGLFLLPAILVAVYLTGYIPAGRYGKGKLFPILKMAWVFPAVLGGLVLTVEAILIFFYVRKSTGLTWYGSHGYLGSIAHNKLIFLVFSAGLGMIVIAFIILALRRILSRDNAFIRMIDNIFSYGLFLLAIFAACVLSFGFRWIISPKYFILTYSETPSSATVHAESLIKASGVTSSLVQNLADKLTMVGPFLFIAFMCYVLLEVFNIGTTAQKEKCRLFKRLIVLSYTTVFLIFIFSMMWFAGHHMLPFIGALIILSVEGIYLAQEVSRRNRLIGRVVSFTIVILLMATMVINGSKLIEDRMYQWYQRKGIAFQLASWWRDNMPPAAGVIADHYTLVYIPSGYPNVVSLKSFGADRTELFRQALKSSGARYVYINRMSSSDYPALDVPSLDSKKKFRLVKTFDNASLPSHRRRGDSFEIWEVKDKP